VIAGFYGGTRLPWQGCWRLSDPMKTLVMIPALGCNQGLYVAVAPALALHADLLPHVPTADRYAGMVKDVLNQALGKFIVLGTSMGARLALEVTLAAPERVEGLVVIGSAAGATLDPAGGLRRSQRIRGSGFEQVISEMGDMIAHTPGPRGPATIAAFKTMCREVGPEVMAAQSDALAYREDRWPRLSEIKCPVLCLWGAHDQFCSCADGQRLSQGVTNGLYVELRDCGHFPTLEYPDESAAVITQWMSGCGLDRLTSSL
jgi:pimeloyl-ACP methyl ester carboxylesterase